VTPTPILEERPGLDPITVEVIGAALASIVDETGETLIRSSYSTNIKERRDCSTALFSAEGETLCQAEHIPIHLGSFIGIVPHIMRRHRVEDMRPGDVFIANDAYEGGGTHLPDIVIAEPIFFEDALVAWTVNLAHHADFVDRGHAHIYQEGLRIPPVHLYRAGVLLDDVQELILLNCQVPHERLSDLRAQMAANRVGVQRFQSLCAKYGAEVVIEAGRQLLDYAERKMRAGIAALPDGTWRFNDVFESSEFEGIFPLSIEVTVLGDEIMLNFEAPDQVRSSLNVTYTALLATVYYIVKSIVDPTVLPNAGLSRPITVNAREGSILNCVHPAAVEGRLAACQRVADMVLGAMAQAVPERVTACSNSSCGYAIFSGQSATGDFWVYLETIGGGNGARATKDGLDGVQVHATNTSNLPVEALEPEYPITVLRYELIPDSGGLGRQRGGMGIRRVYRADADVSAQAGVSRVHSSSWGLAGGGPGARGHIEGANGLDFTGRLIDIEAGDTFAIQTPGGGGVGDPRERSAEAIARDLAEGVVGPRM